MSKAKQPAEKKAVKKAPEVKEADFADYGDFIRAKKEAEKKE